MKPALITRFLICFFLKSAFAIAECNVPAVVTLNGVTYSASNPFPADVTSALAKQKIPSLRANPNTIAALPGPCDAQLSGVGDRQALLQLAAGKAQNAYVALWYQASVSMRAVGMLWYGNPFNPPNVRQAGLQLINLASKEAQDAKSSFAYAKRLNAGGALVTSFDDSRQTPPLPAGWAPASVASASPNPSAHVNTTVPAGSAYVGQSPQPAATTGFVYTATNANVTPADRSTSSIFPSGVQQVLNDRGINADALANDFISGNLNNPEDFLRAVGDVGNYSPAQVAQALSDANQALGSLPSPRGSAEPKLAPPANIRPPGGADEEVEGFSTPKALARKKHLPTANEKKEGSATQQAKLPWAPTSTPSWFAWLSLGIAGDQYPQNIFHIAHRQFQHSSAHRKRL